MSGHGSPFFLLQLIKRQVTNLNTSNKLTVFRVFLIPILILFLLIDALPNRFFLALIVFVIASITDHLDGKLARKNNQITDFGKFLDPLADKMLVMSALICFVELKLVNAVPVIVILLREFIVTSIRLVAMSSGKVVAANIWGKVKTVTQITCIVVVLLSQCALQTNFNLTAHEFCFITSINSLFIWLAVATSLYSGYVYTKENIKYISLK